MKQSAPTSRARRRRLLVFGSAAALLIGGGIAYAYWTQGGSGTGSASTGDTTAITVNQDSVVSDLAPGLPAQDLFGDFDNPNDSAVYVTSVAVSISSVDKAVGAPAGTCDATDYTITGSPVSVADEVAVGEDQGSWTGATIEFNNKATVQDACKGATVNLAYTAS